MRACTLLVALMGLAMPAIADEDRTFGGYECTEDCTGHAAGYDWARDHDVTSTDECGGNSSFNEGCQAYIENPSRGSDEDDDGREIDK